MPENVYLCPACKEKQGRILSIMPLFDDTRYDVVQCDCGAQWRVYYKFVSPRVELTYMPEPVEEEKAVATEEGE